MKVLMRTRSRVVRRLAMAMLGLAVAASAGRAIAQSKPVTLESVEISRQGEAVVVDIMQ